MLDQTLSELQARKQELEKQLENENEILDETRLMQSEADKNLKEFEEEANKDLRLVSDLYSHNPYF